MIQARHNFHENQFAYPQSERQSSLLEAQMVSFYAALAADRVVFNSRYNRETFFTGLRELLGRLPDHVPAGVTEQLQLKTTVIPVPLVLGDIAAADPWPARRERELRILWSARFEYDKGGDRLYAILQQLEALGVNYHLAVTGQQFRQSPPVFERIAADFPRRIARFGFVDSPAEYRAWQRGADVVLSTALHEFQGLAVMEAVALGCEPVVPDRLAYREYYPARCRYPSHLDDLPGEAAAAAALIADIARRRPEPPPIDDCATPLLEQRYRALFETLAAGAG